MSKQERGARPVGTKGMPRMERERLILDAAAQEFAAKGYARGATAVVASRAGITKPLIYEYFGSRDGLYMACLDRAGSRLVAAVESSQRGPADGGRAERTLVAIFGALESRLEDWELVYDSTLTADSDLYPAASAYRRDLNRMGAVGVAEFLAGSLADDPLDIDLVTHFWYGIVSSSVAWWRHHPEQTAHEMALRFQRIFSALHPRQMQQSDRPA
ncbi:TetR/AcrR family transcriptional regulator [Streptomyces sp. NPDC056242]|uniref:TetR/AcrR family transcriptional regulator n=1 Tax=Streptomyces sp. NPDC056242 TaxID=3345760 RepID=UPI0035D83E50